ncbi:uncharacterized protein LDX57_005346 [Aspergillus melleus]|uniref:uncharacterized protein n=1 Tax=Aspergillus melleus TaxID=138277 RepID=UPI001E8DFB8C|nr:uncharacterized protein LDX57_005346 [Aspergillus melleus]KAH8427635.1 hypothetical protein LDX57_005346 [Aspergillus melleus]
MSSEYNKVNALASVYAMRELYKNTLEAYIESGPEEWAEHLFKSLSTNAHAMRHVVNTPIQSGENILNKFCNILHCLDPEGPWVEKFFDAIITFAIQANLSNPESVQQDLEDAKIKQSWLEDGLKDLIQKVLSNDPSLPSNVTNELREDLTNLMKQEGIDQNQNAELLSKLVAEEYAAMVVNLSMHLSYLGQAIKSISSTCGWKFATTCVNKVIGWIGKKTAVFLKGAMIMVVAGLFIFSAQATFSKWSTLTGAERAAVISETIIFVTTIVSPVMGTFKTVKKWFAKDTETTGDLTTQESASATALDESQEITMNSETGVKAMENISSAGGEELRESYAELVTDGQPTASSEIAENTIQSLEPEQPITAINPPPNVPPSAKPQWRKYLTSDTVIRSINVCAEIAFTVSSAIILAKNWDNLKDVGKALNVIQVVTQGLQVLVDASILVTDAMVTAGMVAADGAMVVALPVVGAVLAIIGIVVMLVLAFLDATKHKEPPPTPVEKYLDRERPRVDSDLDTPPQIQLHYTIPGELRAGSKAPLVMAAENRTSKTIELANVAVVVEVGDDDAALFSGPVSDWKMAASEIELSALEQGTAGVSPSSLTTGNIISQTIDNNHHLTEYNLRILGPGKDGASTPLTLEKGKSIQFGLSGTINKTKSVVLKVMENQRNGDKCRSMHRIAIE